MARTKIIKQFFIGQWTVMDSSFLKSLTGTARTCGTREKFTYYSVTGVTVHLYGWGWVEDVSQNIHAYRGRSTREEIIIYPPPTPTHLSYMYYENALTGQRMKTTYDVDRNLDGQFDEKDAQVKYNLNFALLVSPFSWSCGNMLPALLKDYGIPLIGMHTGGGSCAILYNPTAEGFGYRYSTHRCRLVNTKGVNNDAGVAPTYELDKHDFFNVQKVTQLVEDYYAQ